MKLGYYLSLIILSPICGAKNYCTSGLCNNSKQHTLCIFQSEDPARHCIDYVKTIRTKREKQAVLDKLNSRRNKVAAGELRSLPPAERMMKLEWNDELETSAQRWANQCVKDSVPDVKDTCRDLDEFSADQNIATVYGDAPGLTSLALVDVWYMELLNINASILSQYQPSSETSHSHYDYFTQLVWAESFQVGCGGVQFKELNQDPNREMNRTVNRLVCNFAPGGNRPKRPVYTAGLPCSQCPREGQCDSEFKALCVAKTSVTATVQNREGENIESNPTTYSSMITTFPKVNELLTAESNLHSKITEIPTNRQFNANEETITPFDYFSHLYEFTRPPITIATKSPVSCKDVLVVDDFVELLKKKLSTDPMFKELLQTTKLPGQNGNLDNGYTDASVAALVSRIYSKKIPSTTTKSAETDYVNSTLLADLVEAVIFRSGDKMRIPEEAETITKAAPDVAPVKIQAELAEVKLNSDFTGHYFFPEDEEDNEASIQTTESYYDTSNFQLSEVVQEIEDLKRNKATRDFLDEILESESVSERQDNDYTMVNNQEVKNISNVNRDTLKRDKRTNHNVENRRKQYDKMSNVDTKKDTFRDDQVHVT